ncbi:MAG: spore germination protein GerW family protein [Syntrophales bacterium]|nr:spore germination protein GerW family protein [Syntrophales bacterium]MDD5232110.1 spore germination protein GerW family protein [Syntrophales bacterium]MDD5533364.1 spore germination protein GerW family protein [Syntrophales bacterium]
MEHVKMLIETLFSRLDGLARSKTVIGDPMDVKGKIFIPFVEISIGAGGGGFMGEGEGGGTDEKGRTGKGKGEGKGGGTGGCLRISPVGLVSVDEQGLVCVYNLGEKRGILAKMAETLPPVIEKMMQAKAKQGGDEK